MTILNAVFLSRSSSSPVEKLIEQLEQDLAEMHSAPTYSACVDICSVTRMIWRQLFRRFLDRPYSDGIPNAQTPNDWVSSSDESSHSAQTSLEDSPYQRALKAIELADEKLRAALTDERIQGRNRRHLDEMIRNNSARIQRLNILLGGDKTVEQKLEAVRESKFVDAESVSR